MSRWKILLLSACMLCVTARPVLAQSGNAADQYTQAVKDAHLEEFRGSDMDEILNDGYHPKVVVDKALDDNQKQFELLAAGAHMDKCRFAPDVGVLDKNVGPYDPLRQLTIVSMANGLRLYARGQTDQGVEALLDGLRIGLQMQQDKIMSARSEGLQLQLVAGAIIVKFLQRENPPSALLKKHLPEVLALQKMQVPFVKTIEAEKAWINASITDLSKPSSDNRAFKGLNFDQVKQAVGLARDRSGHLYTQLEGLVGSADFVSMSTAESQFAKKYNTKGQNTSVPALVASRLLEILIPNFSHAWQDQQVGQAELEALPTLFALKAAQFDKKAYPASLATLVPAYLPRVPKDPFSNGPFKYRLAGKACLVYSVGPDRKDDGGKAELTDYAKFQGKDIIFRLP